MKLIKLSLIILPVIIFSFVIHTPVSAKTYDISQETMKSTTIEHKHEDSMMPMTTTVPGPNGSTTTTTTYIPTSDDYDQLQGKVDGKFTTYRLSDKEVMECRQLIKEHDGIITIYKVDKGTYYFHKSDAEKRKNHLNSIPTWCQFIATPSFWHFVLILILGIVVLGLILRTIAAIR